MKVVCINDHTLSIALGKIYDVNKFGLRINFENTMQINLYQIINDNGKTTWYSEDVLMPLEKYRELKLKELGI
jgi:hypothetical protein